MSTVKETIERLWDYDPNAEIAVAIWHTDDVKRRGEEREISITQEQAENVINMMDTKHDASIGMNWDVLDVWIDEITNPVAIRPL